MSELLQRLGIRNRSTIVDVGFGRADELRGLADTVGDEGRVYGIEPEKDRVEEVVSELGRTQNITVLAGNALHIPLPDRSADYVLLKGVLHEISDVSKALVEVARVCKKQGTVLIVDFTAFPRTWLTRSNMKWRLQNPRKLLGKPLDRHPGFSKTSLEASLSSTGLKMSRYDDNIATGSFRGHRVAMFLAVGELA